MKAVAVEDLFDPSRRVWCRRALALPMLGLAGCVVAPYGTYFHPSTAQPGARDRRAWCQGMAGPVTGLEMDLGAGLRLSARVESRAATGWPLRVDLVVPPATGVRMDAAPSLSSGGKPLAIPLVAFAARTLAVNPMDWVDPQALRPGSPRDGEAPNGTLVVRTEPLPMAGPAQVTVEGLALVHDAGRVVLPPAVLSRVDSRTRPYDYRSLQEQQALEARVAACRRDTPRLVCQNIIDFAGASHSERLPGARWSWRWWVAPHAHRPTVDGELTLAVLTPGRWRLDTAGLRLEEAAGAHPLRLGGGQLSFRDAVDLVRGLPGGPGETRVLLQAVLPADVADFELVLPAMTRGGERLSVAPLRFERRSFDGGVEPFNC